MTRPAKANTKMENFITSIRLKVLLMDLLKELKQSTSLQSVLLPKVDDTGNNRESR